jgi:hypothetical protein
MRQYPSANKLHNRTKDVLNIQWNPENALKSVIQNHMLKSKFTLEPVGDKTRGIGEKTRSIGEKTRSIGDKTRGIASLQGIEKPNGIDWSWGAIVPTIGECIWIKKRRMPFALHGIYYNFLVVNDMHFPTDSVFPW